VLKTLCGTVKGLEFVSVDLFMSAVPCDLFCRIVWRSRRLCSGRLLHIRGFRTLLWYCFWTRKTFL